MSYEWILKRLFVRTWTLSYWKQFFIIHLSSNSLVFNGYELTAIPNCGNTVNSQTIYSAHSATDGFVAFSITLEEKTFATSGTTKRVSQLDLASKF